MILYYKLTHSRMCNNRVEEMAVNVKEFQHLAKAILPKGPYDFYAGGAEDEWTLKENMAAYQRIMLRPRVLINVMNVTTSTSILGFKVSSPIMIAPTARHDLANPEGEVTTAKAAAAMGNIMVLSFSAARTVEEVAESCNAVRFFQLYIFKQRHVSTELVRRAELAGYKAIVLTVDTPKLGNREADKRNKFVVTNLKNYEGLLNLDMDNGDVAEHSSFADATLDPSFTWEDIKWLQMLTKLPILIKGILTADDAELAIKAGAAGIIVSNHGGRQLDYVPATIDALEEVIRTVKGRVPVFIDGGIRRGTDVFKALALGAQAVLVGRPILFGLAVKGETGVKEILQMLKDEFELAMSLAGCCSVNDIQRSHVQTRREMLRSLL